MYRFLKAVLAFIILKFLSSAAQAQNKQTLKIEELGTWPIIDNVRQISDHGLYCLYDISTLKRGHQSTILKSLSKDWSYPILDFQSGEFTSDDKKFIFSQNDTLKSIELGTSKVEIISKIVAYKFLKFKASQLLIFQNGDNEVTIQKPDTRGKTFSIYKAIASFSIAPSNNVVALIGKDKSLRLLDLIKHNSDTIGHSKLGNVEDIIFDNSSNQLAILSALRSGTDLHRTIQIYNRKSKQLNKVCTDLDIAIHRDSLNGMMEFSANGKYLFFGHQRATTIKSIGNKNLPNLVVSGYKDFPIQQNQVAGQPERFVNAFDVDAGKVSPISGANEILQIRPAKIYGDFAIVSLRTADYWDTTARNSDYVVSLKSGGRKLLNKGREAFVNPCISNSLNGHFIIYFDRKTRDFMSLNTKNFTIKNLTDKIPNGVMNEEANQLLSSPYKAVDTWDISSGCFIVYDKFDIWLVNPDGMSEPTCLTKGYGRQNHLRLRLIQENIIDLSNVKLLVASAYDDINKNDGFYQIDPAANKQPKKLVMDGCHLYREESQTTAGAYFDAGLKPLKSKNSNVWLLKRQTSSQYPNLFITHDFRSYKRITDYHPQKAYQWLTAELHRWKSASGRELSGILYKPENFDPKKKYPLIFNYYEQLSHRLYDFPLPDLTINDINIPYFVSQGYLIFTPDIYFESAAKSGKTAGEWALEAVVSAATHLCSFRYIDSSKLGLQGHSFGGLETSYIATHSKLFAAAMEACGSTDPISRYLTLTPLLRDQEHSAVMFSVENGHEKYGASPWERPDLYNKSSAVLNADKVVTPILIMHNPKDNQVQYRQGIEFFMALRRLGKKAWMLDYQESGHDAGGERESMDFTIRLTQFFDHYLKGRPAPLWMTKGIAVDRREIDTGYELDEGVEP